MLKPMPSPRGTNHAKLFVVAPNPTMAMDSAIGFTPKPAGSSPDNRDGVNYDDDDVDLNALAREGNPTTLADALAEVFAGDLIALANAITESAGTDGKGNHGKPKLDDEEAMASDERAQIAKIIADAQDFARKKLARIAQDRAPITENNFHRRWANSAARVGIDNMGEQK